MSRHKKVTDEQIIAAARAEFLAEGVSVSMDVIAGRLGVTAPVLFMRFGSKLNLFYRSVLPDELPWWAVAAELRKGPGAVSERGPIEQQLEEIGIRIARQFCEVLAVLKLCSKTAVAMDKIMVMLQVPAIEETIDALDRWLTLAREERHIVCGDTRATAEIHVSALYWLAGYRYHPVASAAESPEKACTDCNLDELAAGTIRLLLPTIGLGNPGSALGVVVPRQLHS